MITASFTSMLRISVKDCDHRSQPDVWGNNDRQHRIKPLNTFYFTVVRHNNKTAAKLCIIKCIMYTYMYKTSFKQASHYQNSTDILPHGVNQERHVGKSQPYC